MATNGTPGPKKPTIDDSPDKFLLFGITYLMAAPSDFSQNIVKNGTVDETQARPFLTKAGIDPARHQNIIDFANAIAGDSTLQTALSQLHAGLHSFSNDESYSPTPCPIREDAESIMQKMNELQKSAPAPASALQPPVTNKTASPAQPGNNS